MRIAAGASVRRGIVLLTPRNVTVLGGGMSDVVAGYQHLLERVLGFVVCCAGKLFKSS